MRICIYADTRPARSHSICAHAIIVEIFCIRQRNKSRHAHREGNRQAPITALGSAANRADIGIVGTSPMQLARRHRPLGGIRNSSGILRSGRSSIGLGKGGVVFGVLGVDKNLEIGHVGSRPRKGGRSIGDVLHLQLGHYALRQRTDSHLIDDWIGLGGSGRVDLRPTQRDILTRSGIGLEIGVADLVGGGGVGESSHRHEGGEVGRVGHHAGYNSGIGSTARTHIEL